MKKHFYSHLVEVESIYIELDLMGLKKEEMRELAELVDSSIHHVVINVVLTHLEEDDKRLFLSHLVSENHEEIWKLLGAKVKKAEIKIGQAVDKLKLDLRHDIHKVKRAKK